MRVNFDLLCGVDFFYFSFNIPVFSYNIPVEYFHKIKNFPYAYLQNKIFFFTFSSIPLMESFKLLYCIVFVSDLKQEIEVLYSYPKGMVE